MYGKRGKGRGWLQEEQDGHDDAGACRQLIGRDRLYARVIWKAAGRTSLSHERGRRPWAATLDIITLAATTMKEASHLLLDITLTSRPFHVASLLRVALALPTLQRLPCDSSPLGTAAPLAASATAFT